MPLNKLNIMSFTNSPYLNVSALTAAERYLVNTSVTFHLFPLSSLINILTHRNYVVSLFNGEEKLDQPLVSIIIIT